MVNQNTHEQGLVPEEAWLPSQQDEVFLETTPDAPVSDPLELDALRVKRVEHFKTMIALTDPNVRRDYFQEIVAAALEEADNQPSASYRDPRTRNAIADTAARFLQLSPTELGSGQ